ncbi:hypothetical protein G7B21_29500, partial [Klebsiella pneumoniae]|nr:hypothetical protein [Klebsiella pneumoniae]
RWPELLTACWVVGLRIPAIVATLGTLGLYRGVMARWPELLTACWVVGLRIPAIVATLGTLGLYRGVM